SDSGKRALEMNLFTLKKMAAGGIHDHLGGGFHRYSVDGFWHVPHFEKMLYDQAQLTALYLDAFQITREPIYEKAARDIIEYVRRDMTDKAGGFYSAEDADSLVETGKPEHAEGAYYVWKKDEIDNALGKTAAEIFNYCYGVEAKGNAPEGSDPRAEFRGKNILTQLHSLDDAARKFKLSVTEVETMVAESRQKLFNLRAKRPRPHLDDKIITAWNGLMISACARAYQVLDEPAFLEAATRAASFLRDKLYRIDSRELIRSYRQAASDVRGFVDDYAFLIQGLLDLYEASLDTQWLKWANQLQEKQDALFWDAQSGGYFSVSGSDPNILLRMKEDYDGAEPSPNSVSALNLLRLAQILGNRQFSQRAETILKLFSGKLSEGPASLPQMLVALDFHLEKPRQIVLAGQRDAADTRAMRRIVNRQYMPNKIVLLADGSTGQEFLSNGLEFIRTAKMMDGKATAYVCENFVCKLPTNDPAKLAELLASRK
ncbi:MAG: thioredoxin domain-containing protein, partial [Verrucomicrobiota bacterium]